MADIMGDDGRLRTADGEKCAVFTQHFSKLLAGAGGQPSEEIRNEFAARAADATPQPDAPVPTEAEVLAAVRLQAMGKSADEFGVTADVMRAAAVPGGAVAGVLVRLVRDVWEEGEIPAARARALLVAIYKNKGDAQLATNYRGVVLEE